MKIYTKKGDAGQTALGDGSKVSKDSPFTTAYGTLDELNACLGVCRAQIHGDDDLSTMNNQLEQAQRHLFAIGAVLANPRHLESVIAGQLLTGMMEKANLDEQAVRDLEQGIDQMEAKLEPLKSFVIPAGKMATSLMHLARTVCRRAERELVRLNHEQALPPLYVQYLNRLSDYLFVASRYCNAQAGDSDVAW